MVKGFYTAGSGMLSSARKLDIIGSNIANTRTAGYKREGVITSAFRDKLVVKIDGLSDPAVSNLGNVNPGQFIDSTYIDFEQGALNKTDNPLDLAIEGKGFFTLQTNAGAMYTRNGSFSIDADGYVTNANGGRLMGTNGPVNTGGAGFTVDENGGVYISERRINTLAIYSPANPETMVKQSEGLLTGGGARLPFTGNVRQGYTETSNVSMIKEMMEMISSQRSFQSNSQVVKIIDETLDKAAEIVK